MEIGTYGKTPGSWSTIAGPGKEFTYFDSSTEVVLTSDVAFDTLHSVTGSGVFFGASISTDSDDIEWRIEIDGEVIFSFTGEFLKELELDEADHYVHKIYGTKGDGKQLHFTPPIPLRYDSSLVFSAREDGKKIKYQLYSYTEDA